MTPEKKPPKGRVLKFPGTNPGDVVSKQLPPDTGSTPATPIADHAVMALRYKARMDLKPCPDCGEAPVEKPIGPGGSPVPVYCDCRMQRYAEAEATRNREVRRIGWLNKFERVLPERQHKGLTLDALDDLPETRRGVVVAQAFIAGADEHLAKGHGLFFYGDPGTGKGTVSKCLAGELEAKGYRVVWAKLEDLTQRSFRKDAPELMEALYSADLVVIDELGYTGENRASLKVLFPVIDYRFETGKSTICTANFDVYALQARYHSFLMRDEGETHDTATVQVDRWRTRMNPPRAVPFKFEGRDLRDVYEYNPFEGL
jgi:DNA replication protein DnaC